MISVDRYLERIGYSGTLKLSAEVLGALHLAHSEAVPFENLDIHLGRAIPGDPQALYDKMVVNRRGGYCFEQNGLFADMLERLGFRLRRVLGRTTFGAPAPRPRGHLLSLVEVEGRPWIADVGFGGHGLLEPVPFEIGPVHRSGDAAYRIVHSAGGGLELEMQAEAGWKSLYWFDEAPCYQIDIDVMNFYHSHSADSFFYQNRVVALAGRECRKTLTNAELKTISGSKTEARLIADEESYVKVLADEFGIVLPPEGVVSLRPHPAFSRKTSEA